MTACILQMMVLTTSILDVDGRRVNIHRYSSKIKDFSNASSEHLSAGSSPKDDGQYPSSVPDLPELTRIFWGDQTLFFRTDRQGAERCSDLGEFKIKAALEYCGDMKGTLGFAEHCAVILQLSDGITTKWAMVELSTATYCGLGDDSKKAYTFCYIECMGSESMPSAGQFAEWSALEVLAEKSKARNSAPLRDAADDMTLDGFKDWCRTYLTRYPKYTSTKYSCQRFATGAYNMITGRDRKSVV